MCVQDVGVSIYDGCRCVFLFCVLLFVVCVWRGYARAGGCMYKEWVYVSIQCVYV